MHSGISKVTQEEILYVTASSRRDAPSHSALSTARQTLALGQGCLSDAPGLLSTVPHAQDHKLVLRPHLAWQVPGVLRTTQMFPPHLTFEP